MFFIMPIVLSYTCDLDVKPPPWRRSHVSLKVFIPPDGVLLAQPRGATVLS